MNDKILDEECCKLVSDFLRENNHYTSIEIKGCNINPTGFARICDGKKFIK